jgi:hypothetical protein
VRDVGDHLEASASFAVAPFHVRIAMERIVSTRPTIASGRREGGALAVSVVEREADQEDERDRPARRPCRGTPWPAAKIRSRSNRK